MHAMLLTKKNMNLENTRYLNKDILYYQRSLLVFSLLKQYRLTIQRTI